MSAGAPRVAIVGAGVIGAATAFHLARRGVAATVIDGLSGPAMGVTGQAFGWINLVHTDPEDDAAYALRREAVEDYARLAPMLPDAFRQARRGALVWEDTAEKTGALVAAHRARGAAIELVDRHAIAMIEPRLKSPPPVAARCPDDIALDPARLTESLLAAAAASGASARFGEEVAAIETLGGRVSGVRTQAGTVAADVVVVAAGTGTGPLVRPLGVDAAVSASPVFLLRYAAEPKLVNGIVCGPDLEVRQTNDGSLVVAEDFSGEEPDDAGRRVLETIRAIFDLKGAVSLRSAVAGARPMPDGGIPLAGFAGGIEGLYLAVAHPGVILAPLLGRRAADTILGG